MPRVLLHESLRVRRVIDTDSIYYVEASGGDTAVRRGGRKPLTDIRHLGALHRAWRKAGLVRIHKNHAVNARHVQEVRIREDGRDWEVKLLPPVNKVLPVSRNYLQNLWAAFDGT